MTVDLIRRLYAHMAWADQRLLARMTADPRAEAVRLLSHVLASERVWLMRLQGEDSSEQAIWPASGVEELRAMAAANEVGYARQIEALGPDDWAVKVAYTNQRGHFYQTEVGDILLHVAMHGSYHRGQIAAAMRAQDAEPVDTDYITYVREKGDGL